MNTWTTYQFKSLISSINEAFQSKDINEASIIQLLSMYESNETDWEMFAKFDDQNYTRNLVDEGNGKYNLMILAWKPGQGSCIHDHAKAKCFVKVLSGTLQEIRYDIPKKGRTFSKIGQYTRERDDVGFIDDSIGVHEMKNDGSEPAVSLHLYTPPFNTCNTFDAETGVATPCEMSYWSIFGKVLPEEESKVSKEAPNEFIKLSCS
ncbi:Cysteine dioxygenase type 1, partial [Stegodyphus mimosarum]